MRNDFSHDFGPKSTPPHSENRPLRPLPLWSAGASLTLPPHSIASPANLISASALDVWPPTTGWSCSRPVPELASPLFLKQLPANLLPARLSRPVSPPAGG